MLSPPPTGESDGSSDFDPVEQKSGPSSLPLGHSSVKSLSNKFQQNGNGVSLQNGLNGSQNGHDTQQVIEDQKRVIENLKAQVTSKDRRIQQLEDQIKLF